MKRHLTKRSQAREQAQQTPTGKVVVLHGLFMSGFIMEPLCHRLKSAGFAVSNLSYNSREPDLPAIFAAIDLAIGEENSVIVCHSMGGLLIRRYLEQQSPGTSHIKAVITLGTPHQGSSIAKKLCEVGLEKLLKDSVKLLLPLNERWDFDAALYSIAGDIPLGLQPLLHKNQDSDGTVLLEETKLEGMTDHKTFPISHTAMIYSRRVTAYVITILNEIFDTGEQ